MADEYISHRCEESLKAKTSIRKYQSDGTHYRWKNGKWLIGKPEINSDWGRVYLHTIYAPIRFCPFCGKELE